jgi:1-acyl-sn-glycerol-3-phosphate acyltransferase
MMNRPVKIVAAIPLLIAYLAVTGVISVVPLTGRRRRIMRMRTTSFFSRLALRVLRIIVHVHHKERIRMVYKGGLVVSNHLSYIDVLVISSLLPSVFITSVELKHTSVLGALARFGGCLFVERRKPADLKREIKEIAGVLAEGIPVVLFPEGTTSNGDRVHVFKKSLFDASVSASADILPLCLRYTKINGADLTFRNRDAVFYYGGATFFRHLGGLLALKSVEIAVMPLKALSIRSHASRKVLAAEAHALISSAYRS